MVGAVIGIGLLRGGKNIRWRVLANIGAGWVTTPVIAACLCFLSLFILQNVFNQEVYREVRYELTGTVLERLTEKGLPVEDLDDIKGVSFRSAVTLRTAVEERTELTRHQERVLLETAEVFHTSFFPTRIAQLTTEEFTAGQIAALQTIAGRSFRHKWQVIDALAEASAEWRRMPDTKINKLYNKHITQDLDTVFQMFGVAE